MFCVYFIDKKEQIEKKKEQTKHTANFQPVEVSVGHDQCQMLRRPSTLLWPNKRSDTLMTKAWECNDEAKPLAALFD